MRKPTTNPDNVLPSDILCDFCRQEWREDLPVVEGHQGSVICGQCLATAYRAIILNKAPSGAGVPPANPRCIMCLETRKDPAWQSPTHPESIICKRCINQSAAVLAKDPDYGWKKPTA